MKKFYLSLVLVLTTAVAVQAQNIKLNGLEYENTLPDVQPTVFIHDAALTSQVVFVGGVDTVQTTATYGNPAGQALAKQWHDFIGFTADTAAGTNDLGWVSVNHERIVADSLIGDGGGMTAFKIRKNAEGMLEIVEQTLADGRSGKFFNVDFVNTVGNTGMNCGGITSVVDGRIWTAEEWFRGSNDDIDDRDLGIFTIGVGTADNPAPNGFPGYNGLSMEKYQNYNYMVEIDPKEAVAIRKQYNWGRQPFEGGAVAPDNKTVYLGADATPGFFTRFVADEAGDFTSGKIFAYKHDGGATVEEKWVEIPNDSANFNNMLEFGDAAVAAGASMFNRIEWVTYDPNTNKVYFTETGRDNPASRWAGELADGAVFAPHHFDRAADQTVQLGEPVTPDSSAYWDYYGRVMVYDPATGETEIFVEGGPFFATNDFTIYDYETTKHLSNPDGLATFVAGDNSYLMIQEDLNGTSWGRMPVGFSNRTCEFWLLDMAIENPTVEDLTRIAAVPQGAEVTGAVQVDANTILVNGQHPSSSNPFPFNNSFTVALHGLEAGLTTNVEPVVIESERGIEITVYPNPVSQNLFFSERVKNITVFTINGQVVTEKAEGNSVNFQNWANGVYTITGETLEGEAFSAKVVKN